jgi:flagellar basal body P-ring formation protein FlgA
MQHLLIASFLVDTPPCRPKSTTPTWNFVLALVVAGLTGLFLSTAVHATEPAAAATDSDSLEKMARDFLQPALPTSMEDAEGATLRPEVVIGSLDRRLRLAPCNRIEPHMPNGARLWGRSRIGLRCADGPTAWNVYLPVVVKAWGPAWVLKRPVNAGTLLTQEDAEMAEVDWAEQRSVVLANPELWVGQQAAFTLMPGQALRQNMVRAAQAFPAGAQVRVTQSGTGFKVMVSGRALSPGQLGQTTRVRLPDGRIVTGLVRDGQTVEMAL